MHTNEERLLGVGIAEATTVNLKRGGGAAMRAERHFLAEWHLIFFLGKDGVKNYTSSLVCSAKTIEVMVFASKGNIAATL